jgi:hypothetical protein
MQGFGFQKMTKEQQEEAKKMAREMLKVGVLCMQVRAIETRGRGHVLDEKMV